MWDYILAYGLGVVTIPLILIVPWVKVQRTLKKYTLKRLNRRSDDDEDDADEEEPESEVCPTCHRKRPGRRQKK